MVGTQTLQGAFHRPADVAGSAVQSRRLFFLNAKAKLGGDFDLIADGGKGFPNPFLTGIGAVNFGGVEERHAAFKGPADQGDHVLFFIVTAVVSHHRQAAEADGGNLQRAELPMFHLFVLP